MNFIQQRYSLTITRVVQGYYRENISPPKNFPKSNKSKGLLHAEGKNIIWNTIYVFYVKFVRSIFLWLQASKVFFLYSILEWASILSSYYISFYH